MNGYCSPSNVVYGHNQLALSPMTNYLQHVPTVPFVQSVSIVEMAFVSYHRLHRHLVSDLITNDIQTWQHAPTVFVLVEVIVNWAGVLQQSENDDD